MKRTPDASVRIKTPAPLDEGIMPMTYELAMQIVASLQNFSPFKMLSDAELEALRVLARHAQNTPKSTHNPEAGR